MLRGIYETSPWEDTARIAAISGLADKGDIRKLADALTLRAQDWHEGIGVNRVCPADGVTRVV
jgi:hypothetical protein